MSANARSAVIAGAIALVIYVVISLLTGQSFGGAIGFGLLLGVFCAAVTFAISTLVARSRHRQV